MTDSRSPERDRLYSQIENEYGNVVYTHAAQEEQRTRLARSEWRIKTFQIILSAASTAGIVGIFVTQQQWAMVATGLLTFALLALNSYSFRFELGTQIANHQKAADQLWYLQRQYLACLTDFNSMSDEEVRKERDRLVEQTKSIYTSIPRTDNKSFNIARDRLQKEGLKEFSRDELNLILPEDLRQ